MKFSGTRAASAVPVFFRDSPPKACLSQRQEAVGFSSVRLRVISAFSESNAVWRPGVPCLFFKELRSLGERARRSSSVVKAVPR